MANLWEFVFKRNTMFCVWICINLLFYHYLQVLGKTKNNILHTLKTVLSQILFVLLQRKKRMKNDNANYQL